MKMVSRAALAAASFSLFVAASAQAAEPDEQASKDDIVVTGKADGYNARRASSATRTDTPLLEVPQAITVLTRQVGEDLNATRVEDVLAYAGGFSRGNNFGGTGLTDFNLRGFTTTEYFRNGFPINRGYPPAPDSVTVEQIEVLRGPAALLYGRGDPGGTFNIVPRAPEAAASTTLSAQLNSFGGWRGSVDTTGAISADKTLKYRVGGAVEGGSSFRDYAKNSRVVLAPVIAWDAQPDLTITLGGEFVRIRTPFDRGLPAYPNQLKLEIPASRFLGEPSLERWRSQNGLGNLVVDYRLSADWAIRAGVQFYAGDIGGPGIQFASVASNGREVLRTYSERRLTWHDLDGQVNLTGKFSTGPVEHQLLLGTEFERFHYTEAIHNSSATLSPFTIDIFAPVYGKAIPPLNGTYTSIRTNAQTYAGYAQDQVSLTSWFKLLLGFRVERYESENLNVRNNVRTSFGQTVLTPRLGAVVLFSPQVSLYGSYARSNKPNTAFDINSNPLDPERGTTYESGLKFELFKGAFSLTAAVFHTTKQNVATPDPANVNFSIAAGEVRSRGFDMSFAGNLTAGWRIVGGYAYADAAVTRDNRLPIGQRLPNTPRHSASALSVYELQDGVLKGLGAGVGMTYSGGRVAGTAATAPYIKPYATANLLAYYPLSRSMKLQLNVTNLFDKNYVDRGFGSNLYPGAPRSVVGRVTANF